MPKALPALVGRGPVLTRASAPSVAAIRMNPAASVATIRGVVMWLFSMVVSCFARSPKAFGCMAVLPIHANDPGKTPEFSAILTEKGQRQIVRSEDKRPESFKRTRA